MVSIIEFEERRDKKQFIYIHKVLNRNDNHWTKKMMYHLQTLKKGWTNNIKEKLAKYNLETDFETIRKKTKGEWKRNFTEAVDDINRKRLIQECETKTSGVRKKRKTIHSHLTATTKYNRLPVK